MTCFKGEGIGHLVYKHHEHMLSASERCNHTAQKVQSCGVQDEATAEVQGSDATEQANTAWLPTTAAEVVHLHRLSLMRKLILVIISILITIVSILLIASIRIIIACAFSGLTSPGLFREQARGRLASDT